MNLRVTLQFDMPVEPEDYPAGYTPQDIAQVEKENFQEEVYELDLDDLTNEVTVVVEVL